MRLRAGLLGDAAEQIDAAQSFDAGSVSVTSQTIARVRDSGVVVERRAAR